MYGMVNNAIREYVIETSSKEHWAKVALAAEVEPDEFGSVMHYDDAVTFSLVGNACEVLAVDPADFLHAVGGHWVDFGSRSAFAPLLKFGGHNFEDFVSNLDDLHSKIKVSLPDLKPPSFDVERLEPGKIRVTYSSERDGLFPFAEGLFHGLSRFFDQPIDIVDFVKLSEGSGAWTLNVSARRMGNKVA